MDAGEERALIRLFVGTTSDDMDIFDRAGWHLKPKLKIHDHVSRGALQHVYDRGNVLRMYALQDPGEGQSLRRVELEDTVCLRRPVVLVGDQVGDDSSGQTEPRSFIK